MSNFLPLYPYCMSYFLCYFLYIISTSPCGWKILELDIIQYTSIHPSFILFYVYMWQDYQKFWSLDFGVLPTFEVVNLSHYQLRCHIEGISVYLFWIYVQLLSCFFFFYFASNFLICTLTTLNILYSLWWTDLKTTPMTPHWPVRGQTWCPSHRTLNPFPVDHCFLTWLWII